MNIQTKITPATATIDQLRPGQEYPDGNINARLTYTEAEIDELAASLMPEQDGQLRPFLVATHPSKKGVHFVFAGGRRRLAFMRLIERGDLPKDHEIEIEDFGHISVEKALSLSLADNQAVPMHPADQAATFARLAADRSPEEIAKERGMTVRAVQQSIALGTTLAPEVLAGWRAGKLSREDVEVFTIAADFESQVNALNNSWGFKNDRGIKANEVRRELMRNKEPVMKRLLGFVGVEAARAAGVDVVEDFFGQGGLVKDMKPLNRAAKAKREQIEADLLAAGWSWVEIQMAENFMHHGYGETKVKPEYTAAEKKRIGELTSEIKKIQDDEEDIYQYGAEFSLENDLEQIELEAEFRSFTDAQKAKSGVLVSVTANGAVKYKGGLIRKAAPKAKSGSKSAPAARVHQEPQEPEYNHEVEQMLDDCHREALAELLVKKPKECFAIFLAALAHSDWNGPLDVTELQDAASEMEIIPGKDFASGFAAIRKLPLDKMAAKLAQAVAKIANIHGYISGNKDPLVIVDLIGEKNLQAGFASQFDAKVYVSGSSKQHLLGIIVETMGKEDRDNAEGWNIDLLRDLAVEGIADTGWLPPALRTRLYAGPSAQKAGKAKATKKKAK